MKTNCRAASKPRLLFPLKDKSIFHKMADNCRPEVAGDVISGQRAFGVEVVPLTKFGDPGSNRLATIHKRGGRTDGRTDGHARKKNPTYALCIACTASVG